MPIPDWFKKTAKSEAFDAGWHVPNSVNVTQLVPEWRRPGGGVMPSDLTQLEPAVEKAKKLTRMRIAECELHLRRLESVQ